jgi:predicted Zn-dependent protease
MGAWPQALAEYEWIDSRNSAKADEAITNALLTGAASPEFRDKLLHLFQEKDRLDRATELFQTLLRKNPDNHFFRVGLIQAYTIQGNMDLVRQELGTLSRLDSVDPGIRLQLGEFFLASDHKDLALSQFLRADRAGVENPELALQLAGLQGQAGAYTDAIQTASRVEEQTSLPGRIRSAAALLVGTSSMSIGQDQKAIERLEKAIQLEPDQEANYLALSQVYVVLKKPREAVDVLKRGINRIVPSTEYSLSLGRNLFANDEYEAAVSVLAKLLESHPEQVEAYIPLARACHLTNQPQREVETMRRLAELRPDYPMLPVMLAQSLFDEGPSQYGSALRELQQAEQATPLDADIFSLRAKLLQAKGLLDEAEIQLRRSIELRPTDPALHYQLALLYRKMGKPDLAFEQIEKKNHLENALIPDLTKSN